VKRHPVYFPRKIYSPLGSLTAVLLAGFGIDRLRCEQATKTAGRENQNAWVVPRGRAHGVERQNRSSSNRWAAKQENFGGVFSLDFFLYRTSQELNRNLVMVL
jgi:hypothetical protein